MPMFGSKEVGKGLL